MRFQKTKHPQHSQSFWPIGYQQNPPTVHHNHQDSTLCIKQQFLSGQQVGELHLSHEQLLAQPNTYRPWQDEVRWIFACVCVRLDKWSPKGEHLFGPVICNSLILQECGCAPTKNTSVCWHNRSTTKCGRREAGRGCEEEINNYK